MSPSCHALSKAFEISKKTALISREGLQSNILYIVRTMERSWYLLESCGWKPDWYSDWWGV